MTSLELFIFYLGNTLWFYVGYKIGKQNKDK